MKLIIIATLMIGTVMILYTFFTHKKVNSFTPLLKSMEMEMTYEQTNRVWKFFCSVEAIRVVVKDERLGALWDNFNSDMQTVDKSYKECPSIE